MSLADELLQLADNPPHRHKGPRCSICQLLDDLESSERQALEMVLQNPRIPSREISETLSGSGHYASARMLSYHRRGLCNGRAR